MSDLPDPTDRDEFATLSAKLRVALAAQVTDPPALTDPAGAAIQRARRIRRGQLIGSGAAASVLVFGMIGGLALLRDWVHPDRLGNTRAVAGVNVAPGEPEADPEPSPSVVVPTSPAIATGTGLDLRVGDRIWTTDGRQLELTGVNGVTRVYATPGGWVYTDGSKVRLMRTDGSSVSLSGDEDRWALAPDGRRLAFVVDDLLYVAQIGPTGMAVVGSDRVPAGSRPLGFHDEQVIVAAPAGIGLIPPGNGAEPRWDPDLVGVFGEHDGALLALVRDADRSNGGTCLGLVQPVDGGLAVRRTGGCALDLSRPAEAALSPDGRWLALTGADGVALIEVASVWTDHPTSRSCPLPPIGAPAWADARTLITGDATTVVRCTVDGGQRDVPLPVGVGADWQVVPRLGAPSRTP
jgi:hypothetical protein